MKRRGMTYRVIALGSDEARDARLGTSVAQRLQMLGELSALAWKATGRPLPAYTRREMPVRWSTLQEQGRPDNR
jgi:hypothetical protein